MYPSNPAQPPRPQATTTAREIPGVTKRPTAPMRGMAPQVDTAKLAAASAMMAAKMKQPPAPAMKPMSQQQPAAAPPVPSARPSAPPQQSPSSPMAKAAQMLASKAQSSSPMPAVTADDSAARMAAARQLQAQAAAKARAEGANKGMKDIADAGVAGAMQALGDRSKQVAGMEWDSDAGGGHGAWTAQNALPPGVKQGDPGTYYDPATGTVKYDPTGAVSKALATDTEKLIGGTYEDFLMSPEEKAAQVAELQKAAAMAQWQQGQAMAARGMGGSGVQAMGLGDIAGKLQSSLVDLNASDRAQAIEQFLQQRGQDLGALAQDRSLNQAADNNDLSREQWQKEFDYRTKQDDLANRAVSLNNYFGWTATDSISPEVYRASVGVDMTDPAQAEAFIKKLKIIKGADGVTKATLIDDGTSKPDDTSQPYDGFIGDWQALSPDQQKALIEVNAAGVDPLSDDAPLFYYSMGPGMDNGWWGGLSEQAKANYWKNYLAGMYGTNTDGKGGFA